MFVKLKSENCILQSALNTIEAFLGFALQRERKKVVSCAIRHLIELILSIPSTLHM